ncbi:hypothetical protein [Acinetobacter phage Ab69]|nr:hypothetical protein [Acinetobacter phage Ab69]
MTGISTAYIQLLAFANGLKWFITTTCNRKQKNFWKFNNYSKSTSPSGGVLFAYNICCIIINLEDWFYLIKHGN